MQPKKYLYKLSQAVSKRCGISIATCQVVLPALFDEMRFALCEGDYRCVAVESFGSFIVKQLPKRHYNRRQPDGSVHLIDLPPRLQVTFKPTRNLRREVEASRYDPTRESFVCHPDDHPIRARKSIMVKTKKLVNINMVGSVQHDTKAPKNYDHKVKILRGREAEKE